MLGSITNGYDSSRPRRWGLAAAPKTSDNADTRKKVDRRVLIIFSVFALLSLVLPISLSPFFEGATASDIASRTLSGLMLSFFLAGFSSFLNHRKSGLTPRKRLLTRFAAVSVVISLLVGVAIVFVIETNPGFIEMPDLGSGTLQDRIPLVVAYLFVTLTPVFFVSILFFMVLAFGIIGVMSAIERRVTPWILNMIASSGGKAKLSIPERILRWCFDIPDIVDARTLVLHPVAAKRAVARSDVLQGVGWQLFFGAILAVYASLNPFLSDRSPSSLLTIFSALTAAASIIPLLVLPWFIYRRLDARIKGLAKDFTLFNGVRARLFQSFVAVGTLVILVRLSITKIDLETYLTGFSSFMVMLFSSALMCTFVYLNNFENGLADDIATGFRPAETVTVPETPRI
jgi:hypothetical protein